LPENYNVVATDRQRAIVGQKNDGNNQVWAIQSKSYSLIPNSLIRAVADKCLGADYEPIVRYSAQGEFSVGIVLPDGRTGNWQNGQRHHSQAIDLYELLQRKNARYHERARPIPR
jgi:hypothetical protein